MRILLTGDLGFSTDADEVFGDLDTKLLAATVLLVLVLLGLIYRAVLVALTPLMVVFFSYTVATAFVYLYAKSGASVSSNGTTILIVLMFGVGTDYSLLLVSRYREELRRVEDKHEAMRRALRRTGTTILASGLTVALAMLVLAPRRHRPHRLARPRGRDRSRVRDGRRPHPAPGAADDLRADRVLAASRPGGMRPRAPRDRAPGHLAALRRQGPRAARSPRLIVTVVVFAGGALGLAAYKVDYSTTNFFKKSVDSVEGFDVMRAVIPGRDAVAEHRAGGALATGR